MMKTKHEIGGICVAMTLGAAARWNSGDTTASDLRSSRVFLPQPHNQYRTISLLRATNRRLEPETADQLDGMPAIERVS